MRTKTDELGNVEAAIVETMLRHEYTRNDDVELYLALLSREPKAIVEADDGSAAVRVEALRTLRFDSVVRLRAKAQSERDDVLPTDPKVRKRRRVSEERWNAHCGSSVLALAGR